jgi:plastocyanin
VAAALLVAGVAALAAVPTALGGGERPKKVVTVADNYFDPMNFKVKKGTRIVWKWSADNGDNHDVKLVDRPKGARRFHSDPAVTDFTFRRTLRVRGKYKIVCTIHRQIMRQTITVR